MGYYDGVRRSEGAGGTQQSMGAGAAQQSAGAGAAQRPAGSAGDYASAYHVASLLDIPAVLVVRPKGATRKADDPVNRP